MRHLFHLARAVAVAGLLVFAAQVNADPIQYLFEQGQLTVSLTAAGVESIDPFTVGLDGLQVTADFDAGALVSMDLTTHPEALLALNPGTPAYDVYRTVVLHSAVISAVDGAISGSSFAVAPVQVTSVFSAFGPAGELLIDHGTIDYTSGPATGSIALSNGVMSLTLDGITIGLFPSPLSNTLVVAKADFIFEGTVIPEPTAASLFALGGLVVGFATRNRLTRH